MVKIQPTTVKRYGGDKHLFHCELSLWALYCPDLGSSLRFFLLFIFLLQDVFVLYSCSITAEGCFAKLFLNH